MMKFIYHLTMIRSRNMIIREYSREFWKDFKHGSDKLFRDVLKKHQTSVRAFFPSIMNMLLPM